MSAASLVLWIELLEFRLQRADFYADLAEMYRRGEAMLSFLEGELANARMTGQSSRARALRLMLTRYASGQEAGRLEFLTRGIVPASDALMIAGVEKAANKADALDHLAGAVRQQQAMRKSVWAQALLPLAILPMCVFQIAITSDVFLQIDKDVPVEVREEVWSGFNGLAKWLAEISTAYGPWLLGALVAAVVLAIISLPRWRGTWRLKADRLPLYSMYRDYQAGLMFSALAMLLQTGGSLRGSLEDLGRRATPVMRWQIQRVLRALDVAPNRPIEAFGRGVLAPQLYARAATLHRSAASFSAVLIELGTTEGDRVQKRVQRAGWIANLAVVGALVAISVVMGIASMTVPFDFGMAIDPAHLEVAKRTYRMKHPEQRAGAAAQGATRSSAGGIR